MGGTAPLLSAFAGFFNRYFHPRIPIRPEHMITFAGASICLDAVIYATCDEGDSILLPAPFWGESFHSVLPSTFTTVQSYIWLTLADNMYNIKVAMEFLPNSAQMLISFPQEAYLFVQRYR